MAKEEERALKAADKAAEEAAAKVRQAALDAEKRELDRLKREAAKKAIDEDRARKDDERKKRAQEDLERKKRVQEDQERIKREREEKERKAKEEARLAKERAAKDRVEKAEKMAKEKAEKEEKEAKEKAEKEAKEKLATQQRTAAASASASAPTLASGSGKGSARANNAVASSSTATTPVKSNSSSTSTVAAPALQRLPNNSSGSNGNDTPSKKPANKPIPTLVTSPLPPGILGQGTRPAVQQPNLSRPAHLPPSTPINPQQPHLPQPPLSAGMVYGLPQGPVGMISPPAMSPRVGNFPPMAYGYGGPNMQQQHPSPLSPVPARSFNGGSFDPTFNRGMPIGVGVSLGVLPPPPIGPPTKAAKPTLQGTTAGLAPGQGRHASASSNDGSGPGPITRPMAPIARPTAGGGNGDASSGSGSPNRRSPSPRVLGSSALAADDDEVVSAHGPRRAATIGIGAMPIGGPGQNWGSASPRTALSEASLRGGPWTASPFPSARTAIGPNNHLHQLHHPGPVSPSLWGNTPGNGNGENWHPQTPGFFSGPAYINHNTAASSTPHTST